MIKFQGLCNVPQLRLCFCRGARSALAAAASVLSSKLFLESLLTLLHASLPIASLTTAALKPFKITLVHTCSTQTASSTDRPAAAWQIGFANQGSRVHTELRSNCVLVHCRAHSAKFAVVALLGGYMETTIFRSKYKKVHHHWGKGCHSSDQIARLIHSAIGKKKNRSLDWGPFWQSRPSDTKVVS